MPATQLLFRFPSFPVWRGVIPRPAATEAAPFEISWDPEGFVRQTTEATIIERIVADYAEDGYVHMTQPPGSSEWATRLGEARLDFIGRFLPGIAGRNFLEIGGGNLYVANRLVRDLSAARCTVVDPAIRPDGKASERIVVRREYFTAAVADELSADVVLGFHVFEHLPDPYGFLQAARRAIRSRDGRVILSMPDCEWDMRNGTLSSFSHEHIGYFTDATARAFFARAGFEVVGGESKNGVLSYVLAPSGIPPAGGAKNAAPVPPDAQTSSLGGRIEKFLAKTRREFDTILAWSPLIAVHGATAGVNSLFHLLGAPYSDRVVVFDADAAKSGRYLSGILQAIRHSADPSYGTMGHVFISVPGYREEIERFLEQVHGFKRSAMTMLGDPGV